MKDDAEIQFQDTVRWLEKPGLRVHFLGIGGVGMAGLAVLLKDAGFRVDGCDSRDSNRISRLRKIGIPVCIGHHPNHIAVGASGLIRTPAVALTHSEVKAAAVQGIPVMDRGVVLAAFIRHRRCLAVAGTHGKTTTSAMLAHLLIRLGRKPGFCIGGDSPSLPGLARSAQQESPLVVEADESDGSLQFYEPLGAVVTNIDFDHMEHFRNKEEVISVFERFVQQADDVSIGSDDPGAARLLALRPDAVTFGFGLSCDVRAERVERLDRASAFDLIIDGVQAGRVRLPVEGRFNVLNALGAITAAWRTGCSVGSLAEPLGDYQPVLRRQQRLGGGCGVDIISDYAHHPTEIRELLHALRPGAVGRLIAVFQPHRYTRTRALGPDFPEAFATADEVVLLPVYAASEAPIPGGTSEDLCQQFEKNSGPTVHLEVDFNSAQKYLMKHLSPGDLLLIIGAGDVEELGFRMADELSRMDSL